MSRYTAEVRTIAIAIALVSCKVTSGPTWTEVERDGNCYTYAIDESGPARNPVLPELRPTQDPDACGNGWPIALALSATDYHWWRRDAGGWWSHKPGRTAPTQTDYHGQRIRSPETTYRGPYETFVGYYCAGPT